MSSGATAAIRHSQRAPPRWRARCSTNDQNPEVKAHVEAVFAVDPGCLAMAYSSVSVAEWGLAFSDKPKRIPTLRNLRGISRLPQRSVVPAWQSRPPRTDKVQTHHRRYRLHPRQSQSRRQRHWEGKFGARVAPVSPCISPLSKADSHRSHRAQTAQTTPAHRRRMSAPCPLPKVHPVIKEGWP